jgi:tetratricopeptide (TPR) repeat protein
MGAIDGEPGGRMGYRRSQTGRRARWFAAALATLGLFTLGAARPPAALAAAPPAATAGGHERNDYANVRFANVLGTGLRHFYSREFAAAQSDFESALKLIPDNTLAISFLNAAAAHTPGALDSLTNLEEDAVTGAPKNYVNHVRLAFSYMFQSLAGRDRTQDARDELNGAVQLDAAAPAAHVAFGILRFNERSANRAKVEFLAALKTDPSNVLAREYLAQLYQSDLRDPQRGLAYIIDCPNLVPGYADLAFHIGSLLHDLKQPAAAIKYVQTGIELDPGHVGEAGQYGYTLLARIYLDQHRLDDAKQVLNKAVAVNADASYARTLLAKIDKGDYDKKAPSATIEQRAVGPSDEKPSLLGQPAGAAPLPRK